MLSQEKQLAACRYELRLRMGDVNRSVFGSPQEADGLQRTMKISVSHPPLPEFEV